MVGAFTAERNRRGTAASIPVAKSIEARFQWLEKEIVRTDREFDGARGEPGPARERGTLEESAHSMGPVPDRMLLAEQPELEALDRRRLAPLVGVVPLNRDSDTLRGRRTV